MFRVPDDRPGSHPSGTVARPGPLHVCAHVPPSAGSGDLTGLRVLVMTDLLARAAELGGLQVLTTWALAGEAAARAAVQQAATALVVHPPTVTTDELAGPGGPVNVHVAAEDAAGEYATNEAMTWAATARLAPDAFPGDAAVGMLGGHDPLAIRFALTSFSRHEPVVLTAGDLASAAHTLDRWRRQVAGWARSPSGPIPEAIAATLLAAFDDLQMDVALASLSGLAADDAISDGARFETFAYADRVLALDLTRDIGR